MSNCYYQPKPTVGFVGINIMDIKKVIFNPPGTIVLWKDGDKTVVKTNNEEFDPEKGLAMAISKKALGNKGNYFNTFAKWVGEYEKEQEELAAAADKIVASLNQAKEAPSKKMTCREKLAKEHPEKVNSTSGGGCTGCPHQYDYAEQPVWCEYGHETCTRCWDRPVEDVKGE